MSKHVVQHLQYVVVLTPFLLLVGCTAGSTLLSIVVGCAVTSTSYGISIVLCAVYSAIYWVRDNSVEDTNGSTTSIGAISIMAGITLLVLSEVSLFTSILWSVVSLLLRVGEHALLVVSLQHTSTDDGVEVSSVVLQNTLTLMNSYLLITSGVVSVSALHCCTMRVHVLYTSSLLVVLVLGTAFLGVQCIEYVHLYWCINTSGSAGCLLCAVAVHGSHVAIGTCCWAMLLLWCIGCGAWTATSTTTMHGTLSVLLYWHFVDLVWVVVVLYLYLSPV
uniref:Cytochrome c oxidase subunit 3 n=1 Tax=Rhynchopus euleeides TaxID=630703 RepID=A0A2D2AJV6_9EUGL|nr:cytochrome c oxidase subunit 3 [Rhynchopus euleeides]